MLRRYFFRKSSSLPLVLITPLDAANGLSVVVGVPPVEDKNRKNFMGKVTENNFEKKKTNIGENISRRSSRR